MNSGLSKMAGKARPKKTQRGFGAAANVGNMAANMGNRGGQVAAQFVQDGFDRAVGVTKNVWNDFEDGTTNAFETAAYGIDDVVDDVVDDVESEVDDWASDISSVFSW